MPYDDQTELFYWVDENDKVLGSMTRGDAHSGSKKIHRSVYALLYNDSNQLLMQKRSQHKDTYPGYWTISVSGHVTYPQTYRAALVREVAEEVGITLKDFTFVGKILYDVDQEKEFGQIYTSNIRSTKIKFDQTEIDRIEWIDPKQITFWSQTHPLTPAAIQVLKSIKLIK